MFASETMSAVPAVVADTGPGTAVRGRGRTAPGTAGSTRVSQRAPYLRRGVLLAVLLETCRVLLGVLSVVGRENIAPGTW